MNIASEIIKILKKNLKGLTLESIIDILISKKILPSEKNKEERIKMLSSIYIELLDNNNFILIENQKWILRSNLHLDKIKNLSLSMTNSLSYLTNFHLKSQTVFNDEPTETLDILNTKRRGKKRRRGIKISEKINSNQQKLNSFKLPKISNEINHTEDIDWEEAQENINENN